MPVKVRVTASQGAPGQSPAPALIYHAEAYDDSDRFRAAVWTCSHDHDTVETALHCGEEWLASDADRLGQSA